VFFADFLKRPLFRRNSRHIKLLHQGFVTDTLLTCNFDESTLLLSIGTVMVQPGSPNPTTSYSLFERLRSDATRREAMGQFVERYTKFIISRIRRTAPLLQQEDVSDIAQNVFSKVWDGLLERGFSSEKKNFRKWFAVVIRNEVLQCLRQQQAKHHGKGDLGLSSVAIHDEAFDSQTIRELEVYELQRAQTIVSQEVPNNVWQAFYLSVYGEADTSGQHQKLSAAEIGSRLHVSPERVHSWKFRVLQRLRELMAEAI
jgi:RNA polymerase sigma factor (sigma-70 family)